MQTAYFFKNMQQSEQEEIILYMEKKLPRITRLLKRYSPDGVRLHIGAEKFDKHSAYNIEFKLQLNADDFIAGEASHTITKAIDLSVDRLEMQLKKATETMRRGHRTMKLRRMIKETVRAAA